MEGSAGQNVPGFRIQHSRGRESRAESRNLSLQIFREELCSQFVGSIISKAMPSAFNRVERDRHF